MNSHELAQELLARPVVELLKQTDDEGNGYTHVHGVDFDVVVIEEDYEYNVYSDDEDPEELYMTEEEFAEAKNKFAIIY